jgi:hypothetical protein
MPDSLRLGGHLKMPRPGVVELQMGKGFTPEEEDKEVMAFFKEVETDFGYYNIHTMRVVPDDTTRQPYYVHVDSAYRT